MLNYYTENSVSKCLNSEKPVFEVRKYAIRLDQCGIAYGFVNPLTFDASLVKHSVGVMREFNFAHEAATAIASSSVVFPTKSPKSVADVQRVMSTST